MRRWLAGICWATLALTLVLAEPAEGSRITVAMYENRPLMFTADDGSPSGFVIDLLDQIAAEEGWSIEYVLCIWADCLAMLESGQVDLLGAIAFSEERTARYDFSNETMLTNWGRVYATPGLQIGSVLDLETKTIAVLKADIHAEALQELTASFGVDHEVVEADDYPSVLRLVDEGKADAGVVNRYFGTTRGAEYRAQPTALIFSPVENRFAAPKGENRLLLEAIDRHLTSWKHDEASIYYRLLDHWFGLPTKRYVPSWLRWMAYSVIGLAALLAGMSMLFKRQVRRRTQSLEATAADLMTAEESLREAQEIAKLGRWKLDLGAGTMFWSDEIRTLHGMEPGTEPLDYTLFLDKVHPEDRERVKRAYTDSVREKTGCDLVYRILTEDGETRHVHLICRTEYDQDDEPVRSLGTVQDVTQIKAGEHALTESETRYANLFVRHRTPSSAATKTGSSPTRTRLPVRCWVMNEAN